ncbi:haloalkane dehalogenase [Marinobacter salinisoli]|uniref:Haloalkane dehalogenase n=1 Tax=Marinobacter salinisoli TaxID=2769486 RepID=A0ABX7MTB6_9GAMM|nr:haloalkane dehalogenase [Marinobacter salinisoli]QSP94727.1 haloalkane dehalogenase [Marinobacter salinisoli]
MDFLRTPEHRFVNLPDYPFAPHYLDVGGLRMHYVDEGPAEAKPILMLHGEPSWSYLYRHMISLCVAKGHRVVAPDLIGFGKSDKPTDINAYSYQQHMDWMQSFLDQTKLSDITLVCQDWGSLLGLRLAAENPERFRAIVVGNGMLPTGDQKAPAAFKLWKGFALNSPWFPIAQIVNLGAARTLTKDERRAYDAPFPDKTFKAGARAFPKLVPMTPDDPAAPANRAAWKVLEAWNKPFLTAFSSGDPITRGGDAYMQNRIPGAEGQPHITLKGGHFLQEDAPMAFSNAIIDLMARMDARPPAS